jgi:tRNA A-37 threonylcarbamoyl transferase component Bud32
MNVEILDHGRINAAASFLPMLRAHGLDSFEGVMGFSGGKVARDFPGRRTVCLDLQMPDGLQSVYLKRYEPNYLSVSRRLLRLLHWPGLDDEAMREWQMIHQVRSVGIQTATPISVGQQSAGGMVTRSFVMTLGIPEAVEGHAYAKALSRQERRHFLQRVAEMARRFHHAGFVHKDYYVSHVLVSTVTNRAELFLIDLQRVSRPCCWPQRARSKDLGALAYSMLNAGASRSDLVSAYQSYCGTSKLNAREKQIARRVLHRVAWLRTRRPKHDGPIEQA